MQKIHTEHAPKAIGPYSQGVMTDHFLFVSGQLPIHPPAGKIVEHTVEGQAKQVLDNIEAILKAAGLSFHYVVRAEVFLKDMNDFQKVNAIYSERFTGPVLPARQAFQVAKLPMDALVEISCIAARRK